MSNGILGIDHLLIGVMDLEGARRHWTRLGFTCTPRGRHLQRATGNYCIMFGQDYLELIGIVDRDAPPSRLEDMLREKGEGLIGIALAANADTAHRAMTAAGLQPHPIADLTRLLEEEQGTSEPRFRLVELPPEATPAFRMFCCEHMTPELVRRPEWLRHANGVESMRQVTLVVDEPLSLTDAYGRLFGAGNVNATDDTLTVFAGPHCLLLVTEDDLQLLYPDVDLPEDAGAPRGGAVSFTVKDPEQTARHLSKNGVAFRRAANGAVHVPPEEGNGLLLEFLPS